MRKNIDSKEKRRYQKRKSVYLLVLKKKKIKADQSRTQLPVQETQIPSLGWEDPLEEGMATHSSILTWRVLWTEEPDELQFIGLQRVRHD